MSKMTLKAAEILFHEAYSLLREKIRACGDITAVRNFVKYIDLDCYFAFLNAYQDILNHYLSDLREQPEVVQGFFRDYLKIQGNRDILESKLRIIEGRLTGSIGKYIWYQWRTFAHFVDNISQMDIPSPLFEIEHNARQLAFYEGVGIPNMLFGKSFTPMSELMTNARAGMCWFLLQEVPEFREAYPYLTLTPDKQSMHQCSTHQDLFFKSIAVDNPIWLSILPSNGLGCKCKIEPLSEPANGRLWKYTTFTPDPDRHEYWPFRPFNCLETEQMFYTLTQLDIKGEVLLYKKGYSQEREPLVLKVLESCPEDNRTKKDGNYQKQLPRNSII